MSNNGSIKSSDAFVLDKSSQFGQKKERIDIYILKLLNKNWFDYNLVCSTPFYYFVEVSYYKFSYYVVIWKKTSFITEDFHIINDLLSVFKENNITIVSNSNLENTVNEKFDESAKNPNSLAFWTNNENTIIDFLKEKFYVYYIENETHNNQDLLEFVRFMKTKFRDITFIDSYYKQWLDLKNNKN
ncbi:27269_t:CDS:1 [Dentiscutata erythropus]|uniref:27269_t:CDS:1 n=1 Tax=Dentiscutata erythropus TaxID=1348616 RepID=A0A9N8VBP2_9GLOM|nr:27269_t:CDS:1 [Dentiscutata erythropus]